MSDWRDWPESESYHWSDPDLPDAPAAGSQQPPASAGPTKEQQ